MHRLLSWTAGFLAFPLAGLAGAAAVGPVDRPVAAVLGGAVTGLVVGAGQALASRGRLDPRRWVPATALGMAAGLGLGATAVGFDTSLPALALMGAMTGLPLGVAQALALPPGSRRVPWALATVPLWALGWTVTASIGIDVEAQYPIFGSSGAVVVTLLLGLLLDRVLPAVPARAIVQASGGCRRPHHTP
ncbi:hypothetical protein [Pseudonocardia sp. NPDC049154]|uniref:hypothetical protein n=1 Tax=Pseudonocardia sp. NPDC049154 TaxID=3155501 RepID=UPI0033F2B19F